MQGSDKLLSASLDIDGRETPDTFVASDDDPSVGKTSFAQRHTGACAFRDDHFFRDDLNCKKHSVFPYVFYVPNMSNVMKDVLELIVGISPRRK